MFIKGMVNKQFKIQWNKIIKDNVLIWLMWLIPCRGISHVSHNILKFCTTRTCGGLILWYFLYFPHRKKFWSASFHGYKILWLSLINILVYLGFRVKMNLKKRLEWLNHYSIVLIQVLFIKGMVNKQFNIQ